MALGDSYATLAQLKARVGISGTGDDAVLITILDASSRAIEATCHRQFNLATVAQSTARQYYVDDRGQVHVDDFVSSTAFTLQTDDDGTGAYATTWTSADYVLEPLNGIVDGEPNWPTWRIKAVASKAFPLYVRYTRSRIYAGTATRPEVQLAAQWGWPAVPSNVVQATLMHAEETYKAKDAPFGVAGFGNFGAVRVRDNPRIMGLLRRYIRDAVLVG